MLRVPRSEDMPDDSCDKAIYYRQLKAAFDRLALNALVVAHNVILGNFTGGSYFDKRQRLHRQQHAKFLAFLNEHFVWTVVDSTQGILIAKKLNKVR